MPEQPQDSNISIWFENEVKVNEASLRAYLNHKVPPNHDVDDVIQETYKRIIEYKKVKSIRSPRGLLFRIAKNVTHDLYRKDYKNSTISLTEIEKKDVINTDIMPVDKVTQSDEIEILRDAIASLPERCRQIYILRNFEKLSHKEIASRLNIKVHTVEAQLTIGLQKCRNFFRSQGLM